MSLKSFLQYLEFVRTQSNPTTPSKHLWPNFNKARYLIIKLLLDQDKTKANAKTNPIARPRPGQNQDQDNDDQDIDLIKTKT